MNYKYRITLPGIKGFFRVYHVNSSNTLYTFHKQIRADLEFPMDQPILFKALDAEGNVVARWALVDLGAGTVDQTKIQDTIKAGAVSFVYFYDIASKKNVIITLEGEVQDNVSAPTLIESKGPIPLEFENGYVAFEDLPETPRRLSGAPLGDEDEEEEDEEEDPKDEDREEAEEIYDENE